MHRFVLQDISAASEEAVGSPEAILRTVYVVNHLRKKIKFICVNFLKSSVQDTQIHFVREQFHHDLVIGILKT